MQKAFLLLLLSITLSSARAQQNGGTWIERMLNKGLVVLPVAFYSPETRFGAGLGGYYYFKIAKDSVTRTSNVNFAGIYTQNRQLSLQLPFELAFKGNAWLLSGELAYLKYPYRYFGTGNDIQLDVSELYTPKIVRIKLGLLRQVAPKLFIGPKWRYEWQRMVKTVPLGLLETERPLGIDEAAVSSLGIDLLFDRRNHIFTPLKGSYLFGSIARASKGFGGTFGAWNFVLDVRKYFPIGQKSTIAAQFYTTGWQGGNVPFFANAQMGGYYRMRGYFQGAYRDRHFTTAQVEFRFPLLGILGGAAFVGAGQVAPKAGFYPDHLRVAGGMGLRVRINAKDNINLRIDYAVGRKTNGFYATISEAF